MSEKPSISRQELTCRPHSQPPRLHPICAVQMPQRCPMSKKPSRPSVLSQELAFLTVSSTIQCRPGRRRCHATPIFRLTSCLRQRSSLLSSLALVARVCEMQSCKWRMTVSDASSKCNCVFKADIARGLSPISYCVMLYILTSLLCGPPSLGLDK